MRARLIASAAALCLALPASAAAQNPPEHYTISAGPAVAEAGPGQQTQATFTITRTGFTGQSTGVDWATDPSGTATPDVDYRSDPGGLTFANGETTKTITIQIYGDSAIEHDETVGVKLTDVVPSSRGSVDPTVAYDTILDDDGRPPRTTFDVQDAPATLEGQAADFTVTLSNPPTAALSVDYDTFDNSANSGLDYTRTTGTLTFAAGESSKTVSVPTLADNDHDPNETFGLRLSNSSGPGIGRAEATATITDDTQQPQREHTVLGAVTYEPAFGIGFDGVEGLGPFAAPMPPTSVTVALRDSSGAAVASRTFQRTKDPGPLLYRFDGLGPCAGCTVVLLGPDGAVQDSVPVDFDGTAGQENVDLFYGGTGQGGAVDGKVIAPLGARPDLFDVQIQDAGGTVLADTSKNTKLDCSGRAGAACPTSDSYAYHLTGLPTGAIPVTAVLLMDVQKGKSFAVDSEPFTLDPSGQTTAPDLMGIADPPKAAAGRTLYGTINYLAPFAPGARSAKDLDVAKSSKADFNLVELRDKSGKKIASAKSLAKSGSGYSGYELHNLDACAGCTINIVDDEKKTVGSARVEIPAAANSVIRRDVSYRKAGDAEFLTGTIHAGSTPARRVDVAVTDSTGKKLSSSSTADQACGKSSGTRCPTSGDLLYRLGAVPADKDVTLTLLVDDRPVDSRRLTTADPGEITQAPDLVVPYGRGAHSIQGHVLDNGAFGLGGKPGSLSKTGTLTVVLLDAGENRVATAKFQGSSKSGGDKANLFVLDNLQPCARCSLELLRSDGTVDDRVPVDVRSDEHSVSVADLGYGTLVGGSYADGSVVLRKAGLLPKTLTVQVLNSNGAVLADSSKLPAARQNAKGTRFDYRLGGIPREAGTIRVNVLNGKRKIASAQLQVAPGLADTHVQDLRVDVDGRSSK